MKITYCLKVCNFVLAAVLGTGLSLVSPVFGQNISYIVDLNGAGLIKLGTLGGSDTFAQAINDPGQVVGYSDTAEGSRHAFITGPNGVGITDLGTLGGDFSAAYGINAAGQVVGAARTSIGNQHAFITGANGMGMTDLGTLGTDDLAFSIAYGINAAGQVAGATSADLPGGGTTHAFITGPNGVNMTDLGTLGGSTNPSSADASDALGGVNDAGQVAGNSTTSGHYHAFITGLDGVGMTDLGTLGGDFSFAWSINAAGRVVGESGTSGGDVHAFITGLDGVGMTDLGTLGGSQSFARGINDAGQVVGYSDTADGSQHAFITGPNGEGMTDLNSLVSLPTGIVLTEALAINNHGQIVAIAPIPEPAAYALMLAGLGLVGSMARRKKSVRQGDDDLILRAPAKD